MSDSPFNLNLLPSWHFLALEMVLHSIFCSSCLKLMLTALEVVGLSVPDQCLMPKDTFLHLDEIQFFNKAGLGIFFFYTNKHPIVFCYSGNASWWFGLGSRAMLTRGQCQDESQDPIVWLDLGNKSTFRFRLEKGCFLFTVSEDK